MGFILIVNETTRERNKKREEEIKIERGDIDFMYNWIKEKSGK